MNRIEQIYQGESGQPSRSAIELASFETQDAKVRHALFSPLHYEHGYAYPLIVWLHGSGGSERQLTRVMPLVSMRNYVGAAPRGTVLENPTQQRPTFAWRQSEEHIHLAQQRVAECIAAAQGKFNIAPKRIFIAGFGAGGTMALRIALNAPGQYAGALSIGGPFPVGYHPLWRLKEVRQLPLFMALGNASTAYPESQVCRDLRLFHSAGLSVSLRQYPCGDELTTLMLSDMDRWVMEHVCPSTANCPSDAVGPNPS